MSERFVFAVKLSELPEGGRKRVEIDGKRISLFNIDGKLFAIFDTCPHKKTAPLIRGTLDGRGIKCPNHGYRFDLETGACNVSPEFNTRTFPTQIRDDEIFIDLSDSTENQLT